MVSVYILRCRDNSLYVGTTADIEARVRQHNRGKACRFTASRAPVKVVYREHFRTRAEATMRERQIKRWTRAKKEALIAGNLERLTFS